MMSTTKLSRAAALKRKVADARQAIPAGTAALYLEIQTSGAKSFAMRFRRPGGKRGSLSLGPFDSSDRQPVDNPVIGQRLTVPEAHALAASINLQRAKGVDVIANHHAAKARKSSGIIDKQTTLPRHVRDYVEEQARPKTRRWRETARMLGLDYPLKGEGEPDVIKGGLCTRWRERLPASIDEDDVFAVVDEARKQGIPGLGKKGKGPSEARARKMAVVFGALFKWMKQNRRIKHNPTLDVHRPGPPAKRQRVLNSKIEVRSADEIRWFWRACERIGPPFGPLCQLLLLTGCRREEIAQANSDELGPENAMLNLPGERTKNHLSHVVSLPALARAIIEGVPRVSNFYLFSTTGRTPVSGFGKYKRRLDALMLEEARKERGEDFVVPGWVLHDLRRTAATGMAGIGIAPHIIEAALNHSSGSKGGVAGTYNREPYLPERIAAYERWAAHIADIVSGSSSDSIVSMRR